MSFRYRRFMAPPGKNTILGNRIAEARKALGMSQGALAQRVGMTQSAISEIEQGRSKRPGKVAEIAHALNTTIAWLTGDDSLSGIDLNQETPGIVTIDVIGDVAAGVWSEIGLDTREPMPTDIPADARFPKGSMFALRIRGNSVNRQAQDGDLAVCLNVWSAPREPHDGDWVVVTRTRHGLAETTIKRLRVSADNIRQLWPESNDPAFQSPIPYEPGDETDVQITAFVLNFVKPATTI